MSKGPLLLAGSGEFTDSMTGVDVFWLRTISKPKIAIIPTAAGPEQDWWKWVDNGTGHYKKLSIPAFGVPIRTRRDAQRVDIIKLLEQANAYYFSGGDPGYILSVMKNTAAWKTILLRFGNGAALAGSSAGAMFLGSWIPQNIRDVMESNTGKIKWARASKVAPYIIFPHFDWVLRSFQDKFGPMILEARRKSPWLGIDEDTAVLFEKGKKPIVLGRGNAHWGSE